MPSWIKKLVIFTLIMLSLSIAGGLWVIQKNKVELPKEKKVIEISLKIPKDKLPVSKELNSFLEASTKDLTKVLERWWMNNFNKKWKNRREKKTPPPVWIKKEELQKKFAKYSKKKTQLLTLLSQKVCYPEGVKNLKDKSLPYGMNLIRWSKLVGYHSMLLTLEGKPDQAAEQLLQLSKSLLSFERNCPRNLLASMVWLATYNIISRFIAYPIVHPKLSPKVQIRILKHLKELSQRKSKGLADSFRHESLFIGKSIKVAIKTSLRGAQQGSLVFWPWWDEKQTVMLNNLKFKASIYRIQQPFGAKYLTPTKTEKELSKKLRLNDQNMITRNLQYNIIGLILLGISSPAFVRFANKWHQSRCQSAARYTQFLRYLKQKQGSALADYKELLNPLTKKSFGDFEKTICSIKSPTMNLSGVNISRLPTPPQN